MLTLRRITREPAAGLFAVENRLSQLFNDALDTAVWTPAVDIVDEADAIRVQAEIPGVKPENLKISVEGNTLAIQGNKEQGAFNRAFTIPASVDAAAIKAHYEHGVLTVTLPKAEKAKPREIAVEVGRS